MWFQAYFCIFCCLCFGGLFCTWRSAPPLAAGSGTGGLPSCTGSRCARSGRGGGSNADRCWFHHHRRLSRQRSLSGLLGLRFRQRLGCSWHITNVQSHLGLAHHECTITCGGDASRMYSHTQTTSKQHTPTQQPTCVHFLLKRQLHCE